MNFLKFPAESQPLIQHLIHFVKQHRLIPRTQKLVLAISGGPDSMGLLVLAQILRQDDPRLQIRVITIDHQSRPEQKAETAMVAQFAKTLGFETEILTIDASHWKSTHNFEARASKLRKSLINGALKKGEVVFTGHHLNDSFEWFLMQLERSPDPTILGLPLVNGLWRRPFLCLTKNQIMKLINWGAIPYAIDPTNAEIKFQRNRLRHKLSSPWLNSARGLMKNYVARSNLLAHKLEVHRLSRTGAELGLHFWQKGISVVAYSWSEDFDSLRVEQMREIVKSLSIKERGELTTELFKLCHALRKGRKGPHDLSGGVKAYLWGKEIFFIAAADLSFYNALDKKWENKASQIPKEWLKDIPLKKFKGEGMKSPHPLFPLTTQKWLALGISFQTPARSGLSKSLS